MRKQIKKIILFRWEYIFSILFTIEFIICIKYKIFDSAYAILFTLLIFVSIFMSYISIKFARRLLYMLYFKRNE